MSASDVGLTGPRELFACPWLRLVRSEKCARKAARVSARRAARRREVRALAGRRGYARMSCRNAILKSPHFLMPWMPARSSAALDDARRRNGGPDPSPSLSGDPGFSITRDRTWVVLGRREYEASDIMMVEAVRLFEVISVALQLTHGSRRRCPRTAPSATSATVQYYA
jgi:hypothetical protein